MKTLLAALVMTVVIASPVRAADAACASIPNVQNALVEVHLEDAMKNVAVFGNLPGPFKVSIQDQTTCKISKKTMTQDQLYNSYGIADELEAEGD